MLPCRILYIDKYGVSVTKHTLKVKRHSYPLKDIAKPKLFVIRPTRLSGFLLLVMGAGLIMSSAVSPPALILGLETAGKYLTLNAMIVYLGVLFMSFGIFKTIFVQKRFALRIATMEGEKNAVVSTKRAYIIRIMNTLNTTLEANNSNYVYY